MVRWVLVLRLSTAVQFNVLKYAKTTIFCGFTLSSWQRSSEKFGSIYWRLDLKACQVWQLSTVTTIYWFQTYFCQFISTTLPFSYPWGSGGSLLWGGLNFFSLSRRAGVPPPCVGGYWVSKPSEAWVRHERAFVRNRGLGDYLEVFW